MALKKALPSENTGIIPESLRVRWDALRLSSQQKLDLFTKSFAFQGL
jgi:hypothetical protein